jgi:hypothetical protein
MLKVSLLFLLFILLFSQAAEAHALSGVDVSKLSETETIWVYIKLGFEHILPLGLDHILFILSIFFLQPKIKPVVLQASVFTLAHTITLGLAMYGLISPPGDVVEPIIALSIVFVALENLIVRKLNPVRLIVVFLFGLIHGLGFAGVLGELGLPEASFFTSLISFNLGVELGQISVILIAFLLVGKWFGERTWYRQRIVVPVCCLIALIASYWTIERLFHFV